MKSIVRIVILSLAVFFVAGGLIWGFVAGRGEQAAEAERESPVKAPSRVHRRMGKPSSPSITQPKKQTASTPQF